MITETTALKAKRTRASRKNYQKIVEDLRKYAEISIAVMESPMTSPPPVIQEFQHFLNGQICALKLVLERLEGK